MTAGSEMTTDQEKELRAFADELRKWWSFDNGQMHTHTWHNREDFISERLPKMLAALRRSSTGHGWRTIDSAPKDGTWVLLRGRNAANYPMVPVVAAWSPPGCRHKGWADSGTFKPVDDLAIEWQPLPTAPTDSTPAHAPGVTEIDIRRMAVMATLALGAMPHGKVTIKCADGERVIERWEMVADNLRAALSRPADSKERGDG